MTKSDVLQQNLAPGESILWAEEAAATAYVDGANVSGVIIFGLLIAIFGGVAYSSNQGTPMNWIFPVVGVLGLAGSIWNMLRAIFVLYAITNQRLMIIRKQPWSTIVESYQARDIDFVRKEKPLLGGGTIIFKSIERVGGKGRKYQMDIGFVGIDDVDAAETLILKTFRPPNAAM